MEPILTRAKKAEEEIRHCLTEQVLPFWLDRSVDKRSGGYLTGFDENGEPTGNGTKYLVTQSRMVWGFSNLREFARDADLPRMETAAYHGAAFLTDVFWDKDFGGWYWQLNRNGTPADRSKLVYGEGFAIYALAEFARTYRNKGALAQAEQGFDLLQKYAADTLRGGYYENIERDWVLSPAGSYGGDRKSLDIHMHLLEAFTTLYAATGKEIHARKLKEVLDLIFYHMVDCSRGYGRNQFDLGFRPIPAINILRTWNAERETNEVIEQPTDTTSYGHNVELSWLADLALRTLGCRRTEYDPILRRLLDSALEHGYDREFGGVYRDGTLSGEVLVRDKEWWQNFESMTGFLNGFTMTGDEKYLEAFLSTWAFIRDHFMNSEVGESRQLLARDGSVLVGALGNPWKGVYHTGRALAECLRRLAAI